jgi:amino acid adenylation domain-containing protein
MQFNCFIIGEGTLPIQCGEILLNHGHGICGIISSDAATNRWAEEKRIPHAEPGDDLITLLRRRPFDYLFSIVNIVNYAALLKESLALPRKRAINYHDALLPTYAGFYPTSWALMNREKTHGVTWHEMTDLIDAGDILKQCGVDVIDGDTAFTLNAKCYDAAIHSFAELVEDLSSGGLASELKQDLSKRTFFPLYKRPAAGCVLRWDRRAYDIDAFVRALDFGPYPNRLGLPKLAIGKDFFIVSKIDVLDSTSATRPGTVTAIGENFIKVSTIDREVSLGKVLTVDGEPLSTSEFVARAGLREGSRFGILEEDLARRITAHYASACRHEDLWLKRLTQLQPLRSPYAGRKASGGKPAKRAAVRIPVPREVVSFLEKRHAGWSVAEFILAGFAAYLTRISGERDFDIGYSDVGLRRRLAGLDGFFASELPLRINGDCSQSFSQFFDNLQTQVRLLRQHGSYVRDIVVRHRLLHAAPELQKGPSFPVLVEQAENLDDYRTVCGSELTLVTAANKPEYFCLYDAEVFNEADVARMVTEFTTFLSNVAADVERQPISELPFMTDKERRRVLVEFNNTRTDYPRDHCFHQLFEAQVERTPQAVALAVRGAQLTYQELNARANQLARYLTKFGVGPEIPVAICVERSLEMMVGLLGILKAGGAYVPLHPDYPKERFVVILTDTNARLLLTQQKFTPRLPECGPRTICLDTDWKTVAQEDHKNRPSRATPDNLAYVIYTSGSTGKPNGVMIEHRSLVNYLCWVNDALMANVDSLPVVSRLNFDASLKQLFGPLIRGGRVWALSDDDEMQPAALVQELNKKGTTVGLNCVPSLWATILDAMSSGRAATLAENFTSLFLGGETLSKDLAQRSLAAAPHLQIWNLYGPTETTANAIAARVHGAGEPTIGRPIANTHIYILDPSLNPVPIGMPGEIYIGGVGLARGYLNRPALTGERFIPNPFSTEAGARLYTSGDLGRYLPDGNIEFLGRLDDQVKIRGFRIELKEIENALIQHAAVRETVVLTRDDASEDPSVSLETGKRLVAYVVSNPDQFPSSLELRSFLQEKLPEYMIPSAFVFMDSLPLTSSGKVDRISLPPPDLSRPELESPFVSPRTPTEELLAKTWAEVFKLERVGIYDNFFELGGHSLLATQIISRLREAVGLDLPLRILFENPVITGLAERIETLLPVRVKYETGRGGSSKEREEIQL